MLFYLWQDPIKKITKKQSGIQLRVQKSFVFCVSANLIYPIKRKMKQQQQPQTFVMLSGPKEPIPQQNQQQSYRSLRLKLAQKYPPLILQPTLMHFERKKQAKRYQQLIALKRQEMKELSTKINKEVDKVVVAKITRQNQLPDYFEIAKMKLASPTLRAKLMELREAEGQNQEARKKLAEVRGQLESSVVLEQEPNNFSLLKNEQKHKKLEQQTSQISKLNQLKHQLQKTNKQLARQISQNSGTAVNQNLINFEKELETTKKNIKSVEKQNYKLDMEDVLLADFYYELKIRMNQITQAKSRADSRQQPNTAQVTKQKQLLLELTEEKQTIQRQLAEETARLKKQIKLKQEQNDKLKIDIRNMQASIFQAHTSEVKVLLTKRSKSQNLANQKIPTEPESKTLEKQSTPKKTEKKVIQRLLIRDKSKNSPFETLELGNMKPTPSSLFVSDQQFDQPAQPQKHAQVANIQVFLDGQTNTETIQLSSTILGIQQIYRQEGGSEAHGKKIISHLSSPSNTVTLDLTRAVSLTVNYDDRLVYSFQVQYPASVVQKYGQQGGVFGRVLDMQQYEVVSIQAKLDIDSEDDLNRMKLVGIKIKLFRKHYNISTPRLAAITSKKASMNEFIEENIEIGENEQDSKLKHGHTKLIGRSLSHRIVHNRVRSTTLDPAVTKNIIDHRLMLGAGKK